MKTKLAFFALPLSLGLVLAFVLAACESGGGGSPEPSSSSGGTYTPSSAFVPDEISFPELQIEPDIMDANRLSINVSIIAAAATPITKLEFKPSGIVSYTGPTTWSAEDGQTMLKLSGVNTWIDLTDASISCGENQGFEVIVCIATGATPPELCSNQPGSFNKPQSYCQSSSSAEEVSSSSSQVVVFGSMTEIEVNKNVAASIGSASFTLRETDNGINIEFSSGTIRSSGLANIADFENSSGEGAPMPGKEYPGNKLSGMGEPYTKIEEMQSDFYYLIETITGERYLAWFRIFRTGEFPIDKWPKPVKYWRVEG